MKNKLKAPKFRKIFAGLFFTAIISTLFVLPAPAMASELCNDINDAIKILNCGNDDVITFEGFKGSGLQAPTGDGLDRTLTRAQTAREFIINTVNFALTFLGIIAMVIIIYGGFLYVTAAGNEEQAGKGKKSITYAVIGILIIIASFAIVNTLLTFGGGATTDRGGTGAGASRGVGEEGSNLSQQVVYNLGAAEINNSLNDFVSAYKNLYAINTLNTKLKNLPGPSDRAQNKQYLNEVTNIVNQIKNSAHSLSKTRQVADKMLNEYLVPLQSVSSSELAKAYELEGSGTVFEEWDNARETKDLNAGFESQFPSDLKKEVMQHLSTPDGPFNIFYAAQNDFEKAIEDIAGPNLVFNRPGTQTVKGRLPIVWKIMGPVADVVAKDTANQALERGLITDKDLSRAFEGIDPNTTVGELFQEALLKLNSARALRDDPTNTDLLIDAIKSLNRLYIVIKDIKFTYVKIRASERDGAAPLLVELNGLDSRDPTGQTIEDNRYIWDPDGDGQDGVTGAETGFAAVNCFGKEVGATITCAYNQPGTYLVRLTIKSKDPEHIASGQAFLSITVGPSVARIGLKATVGSVTEDLRKYEIDNKGQYNLAVDKTEFHVTTEEAKSAGVTFDATSSQSGTGSELKNFAWSFGDGTQAEEGPSKNRIEGHKYNREGKFTMKLEVTDTGNRKDRKIINIVIASLAARIGAKQTISEPDNLLEFDGSLSRSDNGSINSYRWSIINKDSEDIINFQNVVAIVGDPTLPVLRVRFKQPGNYLVKLQVADGNATADSQIPISIRSRKPRANFTVRACPTDCPDPTQPAIVDIDGSISFDPDAADVLTYNWTIKNAVGDKLEPRTGFDIIDPPKGTLSGQNAKRLRIRFKTVGKYSVILNVNDSHKDPSILQQDSKEKIIDVSSIIEAKWAPDMKSVYKLQDGVANAKFKLTTKNADQLDIDFGDSQTNILRDESRNGQFVFEHEYEKAGVYLVTVTALSEMGNGENILTKKIFIAKGDAPLAVINATIDGIPVTLPIETKDKPAPALETIRKKIIKFDASESIDSRGVPGLDGLKFSWDFGDGGTSTGAIVQRSYTEVSPKEEPFKVILTVTERTGDKKIGSAIFPIRVIGAKPIASSLMIEKKTAGNRTPIDVEITAEAPDGKFDQDGKVSNFQFWYYDPGDEDTHYSVIDTSSNRALLTVETKGEENEEHEYVFCVRLTDNDNQVTNCFEMFREEELPKLKVRNGPNKAPVAKFSADRTNIKINDAVTFTSASMDVDGNIESYIWDTEGDGFQNDKPTKLSTITHTYSKKSPNGGYRVKLKVIDDKGAAGYSKEVPIFVSSNSLPPVAKFSYLVNPDANPSTPSRVQFFDASTWDKVNNAKIIKWSWDFDTAEEYGCNETPKPKSCNGDKTDDIDSSEKNPTFEYPSGGTHQVKLTVEDNYGNTADSIALVNVVGGLAGGTGGNPDANVLKAELKSDVPFTFETIGGEKRKVIRIPATSNGENITLTWGDSRGKIQRYEIDKNIFCDSDGNGSQQDDIDNPDPVKGTCKSTFNGEPADHCWNTNYQRYLKTSYPKTGEVKQGEDPNQYGSFRTRLKVIDSAGKVDIDTIDVIFEGETDETKIPRGVDCNGLPAKNPYGASIFETLGLRGILLFSILAGVAGILGLWGAANIFRSGKKRNV